MANDILRFAILGLGAGAVYAITALGVVLVYRGSGVVELRARRDRHGRRVHLLQPARVGARRPGRVGVRARVRRRCRRRDAPARHAAAAPRTGDLAADRDPRRLHVAVRVGAPALRRHARIVAEAAAGRRRARCFADITSARTALYLLGDRRRAHGRVLRSSTGSRRSGSRRPRSPRTGAPPRPRASRPTSSPP